MCGGRRSPTVEGGQETMVGIQLASPRMATTRPSWRHVSGLSGPSLARTSEAQEQTLWNGRLLALPCSRGPAPAGPPRGAPGPRFPGCELAMGLLGGLPRFVHLKGNL